MKPYDRETAEAELTAALDAGDLDAALQAATALDRLPPKPQPSVIGAALWYASHGLPVFPLQPGTKVPLPGSRGVKDATTDRGKVRALFNRPGLNLGLATGHRVDVLDFDGPESHAAWSATYGPGWAAADVTVLATVSTPRAGGLHVYVPTPPDHPGNRAGLVTGVDYRGLGGYVVAPPSETPAGPYRFLRILDPRELP